MKKTSTALCGELDAALCFVGYFFLLYIFFLLFFALIFFTKKNDFFKLSHSFFFV